MIFAILGLGLFELIILAVIGAVLLVIPAVLVVTMLLLGKQSDKESDDSQHS